MERFSKRTSDPIVQANFEHIFQNALGTIVNLPSAPTAQADMKANTLGYYDGDLFIRLPNGEIKKVTLTSVV